MDKANGSAAKLRVIHFVDAAGASDRLWGKENVIVALMEAQRASGRGQAAPCRSRDEASHRRRPRYDRSP